MKRQPVLKKPTLDLDLSPKEFRTFYWLKADLQHFCREHELSTAGSKEDLTKRIEHFLLTGKRLSDSGRRANPKMPSEFSLTDEVPLNFRCTREARNFFIQKPGKTFKYSVELQKYIKANPGITFQKVVDHWQFLILQHRLGEKTQIGDQFEYNQFTRDFFAELKKTARKRSPRSGRSKYKIVNSSKLARIRIDEKLVAFNKTQVPFTQRSLIHLGFCIKRGRNDYWAGINAFLYAWKIAHVDILWVDEALRGQGVGSELLRKVENKAKELGCKLIHLDTFDFQAKNFYLKQGYKVFGKLKDCPKGHDRYYLQKKL